MGSLLNSYYLFCLLSVSIASGGDLVVDYIPNGSFELWSDSLKPVGWLIAPDMETMVTRDSTQPEEGRFSLRVTAGGKVGVFLLSKVLHVSAGRLSLLFSYRTDNRTSGSLVFWNERTGVSWDFDSLRWSASRKGLRLRESLGWKSIQREVGIPQPDAYRLAIVANSSNKGSHFWIDNLSLEEKIEPFHSRTKIGVVLTISSYKKIPLSRDTRQLQALRELNPQAIRLTFPHFNPITSYSPEKGFTYDWREFDSTITAIRRVLPQVDLILMVGFPKWYHPPGVEFISLLSAEKTGGYYNFLTDTLMATLCKDLATHSLKEKWKVRAWIIHNEPRSNTREDPHLVDMVLSNYRKAAKAIRKVIPDARVTMGFINSNAIYDEFAKECADYASAVSVHKAGGMGGDEDELFLLANRWNGRAYSPERRTFLLSEASKRENVVAICDECSKMRTVYPFYLSNTTKEPAYLALTLQFALLNADYWLYIPFSMQKERGKGYQYLTNPEGYSVTPAYWFLKLIREKMSSGALINSLGNSPNDFLTWFGWKEEESPQRFLLVNRSRVPQNLPDFLSGLYRVFRITSAGIDSTILNLGNGSMKYLEIEGFETLLFEGLRL